jgi:hypothetical protein
MTCRARLRATRFAARLDNEDEFYWLSTACVRPLVEYWADGFDWHGTTCLSLHPSRPARYGRLQLRPGRRRASV